MWKSRDWHSDDRLTCFWSLYLSFAKYCLDYTSTVYVITSHGPSFDALRVASEFQNSRFSTTIPRRRLKPKPEVVKRYRKVRTMPSWTAFLLLLGTVLAGRSLAEQCISIKGYSSCACKLNETKQVFSLVPLAPKSVSERPRFTANHTTESWLYSYNPCEGFDKFFHKDNTSREIPCLDVSVARWTNSPPHKCEDLGDPKTASFDYTYTNLSKYNMTSVSNLSITFTALNDTVTKNQAVIYLICNSNMTYLNESVFKYLYSDPSYPLHSRYYFTLESRCGCPGLCGVPKTEPSKGDKDKNNDTWLIIGVSIGAVVILLLVILAVICCRTKRSGYTYI